MTSTVFPQVRTIAADIFDVAADSIVPESSPETLERWDSIQHLNLVLALEERFGFELLPDEMERMHTIGDIVQIIERKTVAAG